MRYCGLSTLKQSQSRRIQLPMLGSLGKVNSLPNLAPLIFPSFGGYPCFFFGKEIFAFSAFFLSFPGISVAWNFGVVSLLFTQKSKVTQKARSRLPKKQEKKLRLINHQPPQIHDIFFFFSFFLSFFLSLSVNLQKGNTDYHAPFTLWPHISTENSTHAAEELGSRASPQWLMRYMLDSMRVRLESGRAPFLTAADLSVLSSDEPGLDMSSTQHIAVPLSPLKRFLWNF